MDSGTVGRRNITYSAEEAVVVDIAEIFFIYLQRESEGFKFEM